MNFLYKESKNNLKKIGGGGRLESVNFFYKDPKLKKGWGEGGGGRKGLE